MIGCVEYILMLLFYNIGKMKKISKDCVVFIRWLNNDIVYVFLIGIVIMILNIYLFLKYIKFFGNFNCWYIDYWYYMNIFLGIYICSFILNII